MHELIEYWDERFSDYSYNNRLFGRAALHLIIGQCLRYQSVKKKGQIIDCRIHPWVMMDTGSGKSVALDYIVNCMKDLSMEHNSIGAVTDAALLGTVEQVTKYNEYNDKVTEYEHRPGILASSDVIHFDEAEVLLNTNNNNENMKLYFQMAMNPIGTPSNIIKKKLAHGDPIELPVHSSFFFTSYVPEKFESLVVHTGLLPRMFMVPKELTYQDRVNNSQMDIDNLGEDSEIVDYDDEIMKHLKKIQTAGRKKLTFDFSRVKPLLKNRVRSLYDIAIYSSHSIQKLYNGFVPRYQNQMYVIACHHAVMHGRTNIKNEDINYAYETMIKPAMASILTLLEVSTRQKDDGVQKEKTHLKLLMGEYEKMSTAEGGWVGLRAMSASFGMATHTSESTARSHIKSLINKDYFEEKNVGNNVKMIKPKKANINALLPGLVL